VTESRAGAEPADSAARYTALSLLAGAWFSLVFFLAFPAAVLWASDTGWLPPPGPGRWLGAAIIVAAQLALIRPVQAFIVEGRGTQAPPLPPRRLVAGGLHARVRNPMYLLYALTAFGEAILYRSPALLAYAVCFWALEHGYVVVIEEKELRRRFGDEYAAYCARVNRWLPTRRGGS
jgi:protein-S-isoprenylcysteine O-methyltransferase Ste14